VVDGNRIDLEPYAKLTFHHRRRAGAKGSVAVRSGPGKKPDPEQVIKEYLTAFAEANGRRRGDL